MKTRWNSGSTVCAETPCTRDRALRQVERDHGVRLLAERQVAQQPEADEQGHEEHDRHEEQRGELLRLSHRGLHREEHADALECEDRQAEEDCVPRHRALATVGRSKAM